MRMPAVIVTVVACSAVSFAAPVLREDFSRPRRLSVQWAPCWEFQPGRARFLGVDRESRLVTNMCDFDSLTATTSVQVEKRTGANWAIVGLLLFENSQNMWRLMLVESPRGRRYLELIERYQGVRQAQNMPGPTRLPAKLEGKLRSWEYGRKYELRLAVTPKAITAEVRDAATGRFWRKTFSFAGSKAVRKGRPALCVAGFSGAFGVLTMEGQRVPPIASLKVAQGEKGAAVVVPDETGRVAKRVQEMLQNAGYGVTFLPWDAFDGGRIPANEADLLVLADARRVPDVCKAAVVSFLRAGGKLMAIAAPAFGWMLSKTPTGWEPKDRYNEALYRALTVKPLTLAPGDWQYAAKNPTKPHAATSERRNSYKFFVDLEGWATFARKLAKPFRKGRSVLTFWAKGTPRTPKMCIECREADGSRWIGAVELAASWKPYVMRPQDFPNWPHPPGRRGGPGDRVNFENVVEIRFGLAGSHTPKCRPGPHTFFVRDIACAAFPYESEPDFRPPEIEALSPSYKLYALENTAALAAGAEQGVLDPNWRAAWSGRAYSPVWRPRGRGFGRGRSWRWIPIVTAADSQGRRRGALISLMLGDHANFGAIWANIGVANPGDALRPPIADVLPRLAEAMTSQCFLLEGGSRFFSYRDGERIELGAVATNPSRRRRAATVSLELKTRDGTRLFRHAFEVALAPRGVKSVTCDYAPGAIPREGLLVETRLLERGRTIDRITHAIDRLPSEPARPDEFVQVRGSNFYLGGKKWFMRGVNYRANFIAGYPTLNTFQRDAYDPAIIERDLSTMQRMGINFLSAIHALQPPQPDDPSAYRDLTDFLNRCRRHGMKVFYFLPWGNPFGRADVASIKRHIEAAGIKDNPAILAWELAWEPIYGFGKRKHLPDLRAEWTRWIEQRYGSVESAERDWNYKLPREKNLVAIPTAQMCTEHGEWDRTVAAFRRFYSDYVSQCYLTIVTALRPFDSRHLITFRGGGCGIPYGWRFAHLHSVGVAKHIDFLCPEGYNLRTTPWGQPTPADDIRKGGLITLYYRFVSREKPVVWMEFGYTVNGFRGKWKTERVHIPPQQLVDEQQEYEHFYRMFLESGARGAAPWWLPGGFRLGENSDFGILNPDGTERPCAAVMRTYMPMFAQVRHQPPNAFINFDLDAHYADSWPLYGQQYLDLVKSGKRPFIRTAGTGTNSANTPLTAVGDVAYNGHNPPIYLNAEFNSLEMSFTPGVWREVRDGDVLTAPRGAKVLCRASVGNIGEAAWLAPRPGLTQGGVYLAGRKEYGLEFKAPIASDTNYLHDATVKPFVLIPSLRGETRLSFELLAEGRAHFGERRRVVAQCK